MKVILKTSNVMCWLNSRRAFLVNYEEVLKYTVNYTVVEIVY
jgi:hypothetical protein